MAERNYRTILPYQEAAASTNQGSGWLSGNTLDQDWQNILLSRLWLAMQEDKDKKRNLQRALAATRLLSNWRASEHDANAGERWSPYFFETLNQQQNSSQLTPEEASRISGWMRAGWGTGGNGR